MDEAEKLFERAELLHEGTAAGDHGNDGEIIIDLLRACFHRLDEIAKNTRDYG